MRLTGVPARMQLASLGLMVLMVLGIVGGLVVVLLLGGFDVGVALRALVGGAFGSWYALTSATLVRATPLIFTGLAVALAFQGGILNIGAEGQLLAGAAAATALALRTGDSLGGGAAVIGFVGAAIAGAGWALLPAWLRQRYGVLEVITTIMMNFIALYLVSYLIRGPLQEPTHIYPQSPSIPVATRLPFVLAGSRLHIGFLFALVIAAGCGYALRFTAAGFRLRVVGANPSAAESAGRVAVGSLTFRLFLISGALAGLAGGVQVLGVTYALYENLSPGYGYTAIAVALLAGLRPGYVVPSGLFLGALEAGAASMQREAGVPLALVSVVEAMLILALVGGRAILERRQRITIGVET